MTPTAEQRERDRQRYANMTDEQRAARKEHDRERRARRAHERRVERDKLALRQDTPDEAEAKAIKAARERERYANLTPAEKERRLQMIRDGERRRINYIGNGIPDLPMGPTVRYCLSCGARLTIPDAWCDWICHHNWEVAASKRPLPATVGVFHRHERVKG